MQNESGVSLNEEIGVIYGPTCIEFENKQIHVAIADLIYQQPWTLAIYITSNLGTEQDVIRVPVLPTRVETKEALGWSEPNIKESLSAAFEVYIVDQSPSRMHHGLVLIVAFHE